MHLSLSIPSFFPALFVEFKPKSIPPEVFFFLTGSQIQNIVLFLTLIADKTISADLHNFVILFGGGTKVL